jgi:predicted nuclease of predicted toxin-antitoxin system
MKIKLYLDEDSMDRDLVRALEARGVDVTTALIEKMINRADFEHLNYATAHERVITSFNVGDFYALHRQYLSEGKPHGGMVLVRQQQYSVGEQMRRILKLIAAKSAEDMQNQVEFLSAWG